MKYYKYMLTLAIALGASGVASPRGIGADHKVLFSPDSSMQMLPYARSGVR